MSESGFQIPAALQPLASRRRSTTLGIICVFAAIGIGVALASHGAGSATKASHRAAAIAVTSASPRHATWPRTIEAQGTIAAWQEASIGAQIGGYQLIDVRVNVGDEVKRGQLLARLNPDLLKAEEAQLRASRDQAAANRDRVPVLEASGAIGRQDALQYETSAKTTQALFDSNQLLLKYTAVLAPDDGAISSRTATLGAVVPVGQELFRLIRQNRLEWRGELTPVQLSRVKVGQRIVLSLPDGTAAEARVRITAPSLNPQSRLATVYADMVRGSSARAGMYANGSISLGEGDALSVPAESVVIRDGRTYVLKMTDRGSTPRVSLGSVVVGQRRGDEVEILSGVTDTDRVVADGAGFVNEGDVVRVEDAEGGSDMERAR